MRGTLAQGRADIAHADFTQVLPFKFFRAAQLPAFSDVVSRPTLAN